MRVKSLAFIGHPSIGSIALDFCEGTGQAAPVIILAGANGTGKSAILDALFGITSYEQEGWRVCQRMSLSGDERHFLDTYFPNPAPNPSLSDEDLYQESGRQTNPILRYRGAQQPVALFQMLGSPFRTIMIDAVTQFTTINHQTISSSTLDDPNLSSMRSGDQLGTNITQLLIDINAADAEDVQEWLLSHPGSIIPSELVSVRLSRFRSAFEMMFPNKKLIKVERGGGRLAIMFEEYGVRSSIDKLSTGEKQIVFKAGFLLRNRDLIRNAVVLIDEPELGLHPDWQARIIGFFRHILSDAAGEHPQIIVATHSPFVVHGIDSGKVIILERDEVGVVREMPHPAYPGVHGLEAVRAFNLDRFLNEAQRPLLVLTEGESDATIIATAWSKLFGAEPRPFDLRAALGAKNINITLNDQDIVAKLGSRKLLGVFDYDSAYDQWKGVWTKEWRGMPALTSTTGTDAEGRLKKHASGQAWCILLPVPASRAIYANDSLKGGSILTIELLFEDGDIPPTMITHKAIAGGHTLPKIPDGQKTAFAAHIATLPQASFEAFRPLFDRIRAILAGTA